jgi:hypothetical protein
MLVDATCALAFVEHRADDMARHALLALGDGELGDARVDRRAHVRGEGIQALAKQLPLGTHHPRHLCQPAAARITAATARPPRALLGGRAGATVDVVVEGEELLSHHGRPSLVTSP